MIDISKTKEEIEKTLDFLKGINNPKCCLKTPERKTSRLKYLKEELKKLPNDKIIYQNPEERLMEVKK